MAATRSTRLLSRSPPTPACRVRRRPRRRRRPVAAAEARVQLGSGQAGLDQDRLHLRPRSGRTAAPSCCCDHVERRLGDVQVPLGHQPGHLAVEEGHQQGADVRAVDVGVAHHDDLAVPPLARVFLVADAVADGRDDVADLLVAEHAVEPGALDVEDLAAEREDRLVEPVAAPLGGAAGRVALDEEQLAGVLVVGGAVHQLAGQAAAGEDPLAVADQLAGLAGRLAGLGGQLRLGDDLLGRRRVLSPGTRPSLSLTTLATIPSTSPLPSLVLVWPSNCGSGTRTLMIAVSPSLKSSPVIARSLFLAGAAALA